MKAYIKSSSLILSILPALSFAIDTGFYGDVALGVSSGPASVVAPSAGFGNNTGGTVTGGVTDLYGLNTQGALAVNVDLGYNFRPYFGIEADYTYWGSQDLSTFTGQITTATGGMSGNLTSQSIGGNLVGYIPLDNEQFNIYGKLGVAALYSTLSVNDPQNVVFFNTGNYSQSSAAAAMTYGAGVQYRYNPNISFLLSWNGISQFDDHPISNLHYNVASVGVRYTIPNKLPAVFQK